MRIRKPSCFPTTSNTNNNTSSTSLSEIKSERRSNQRQYDRRFVVSSSSSSSSLGGSHPFSGSDLMRSVVADVAESLRNNKKCDYLVKKESSDLLSSSPTKNNKNVSSPSLVIPHSFVNLMDDGGKKGGGGGEPLWALGAAGAVLGVGAGAAQYAKMAGGGNDVVESSCSFSFEGDFDDLCGSGNKNMSSLSLMGEKEASLKCFVSDGLSISSVDESIHVEETMRDMMLECSLENDEKKEEEVKEEEKMEMKEISRISPVSSQEGGKKADLENVNVDRCKGRTVSESGETRKIIGDNSGMAASSPSSKLSCSVVNKSKKWDSTEGEDDKNEKKKKKMKPQNDIEALYMSCVKDKGDKEAEKKEVVVVENDPIIKSREIMRGLLSAPSSSSKKKKSEGVEWSYVKKCTNNFSDDVKIGEGSYGEVYVGKDDVLKKKFAVKRLRLRESGGDDDKTRMKRAVECFQREVETLKHLHHPNIIRLYAHHLSTENPRENCLIYELASNGSLHDHLLRSSSKSDNCLLKRSNEDRHLSWIERIHIASDIASALAYMHSPEKSKKKKKKKIKKESVCFHCDVKSSNIVLKRNGSAKLVDCGVSKVWNLDESECTLTLMQTNTDGAGGMGCRGTAGYMCPVYARRMRNYTAACDVFSFGIVLCELITGILQGSKSDGEEQERVDLFDRYGIEQCDLAQDVDASAGTWDGNILEEFVRVALECIQINPKSRPESRDVADRLNKLSAILRPQSQSEANQLTVLFSEPLVYRDPDSGDLKPLPSPPNVALERHLLTECLTSSNNQNNNNNNKIKLNFDVATDHRLQAALTNRCSCIHFSGHGHPSALLFEDGSAGAHWLTPDHIRDTILLLSPATITTPHNPPLRFAFISACYSEQIARTLISSHVPHVICSRVNTEIRDDAAIRFEEAFYHAVREGFTIRDAFHKGKNAVKGPQFGQGHEDNKFLLLPEDGDHDVTLFHFNHQTDDNDDEDDDNIEEEIPEQDTFIPSPPLIYIGREVDKYRLFRSILSNRLITLVGDVGIGKSSLASSVSHYIQARKTILPEIQQVYYLRKTTQDAQQAFLNPLYCQLFSANGEDEMDMMKAMARKLQNQKALIVFDGVQPSDYKFMDTLLACIFQNTNHVKILLTSSRPIITDRSTSLSQLCNVHEHVFCLDSLSMEESVLLLGRICTFADTFRKRELMRKGLMMRRGDDGVLMDVLKKGNPSEVIRVGGEVMTKEMFDSIVGALEGEVEPPQ